MSLLTNIVAYYKTDESSGDAADSVGSRTLVNTNTVGYVAGKINNASDLGTSNTNKRLLYTTDSYGITTGAISISGWVKMNTEIASGDIRFMEHRNGANGISNYVEYQFNGGTRRIKIGRDRSGAGVEVVYSTLTMGTSNYYHFAMCYDGTTIEGYVDGASIGTIASSGSGGAITSGFCVGATVNGFLYASALVDEIGLWDKRLSSAEVTELYNGGVGLSYPFSSFTPRPDNRMYFM